MENVAFAVNVKWIHFICIKLILFLLLLLDWNCRLHRNMLFFADRKPLVEVPVNHIFLPIIIIVTALSISLNWVNHINV